MAPDSTEPPADPVLESLWRQARSCAHLGSPLYAALLEGLAGDWSGGGPTRLVLEHRSQRPVHDALPLRYLAAVHHLALSGRAPGVAALYPSCGGEWTGADPTGAFLEVVTANLDHVTGALGQQVQTNEVGRAPVVAAGMAHVAAHSGLPIRSFEVGAAGGLLSQWMHYHYDTGTAACGPIDAPVRFEPAWFGEPSPPLHDVEVIERRASDPHPVDPTDDAAARRLLSFIWPDQPERLRRLRAAIEVARARPLTVESADAGRWLQEVLQAPPPAPCATVVFHTIVWQYLPESTRVAVRDAFATASWASPRAPLYWLRMEPASPAHADVRLTVWPGGITTVLATVGYHGAGLALAD